MSEQQKVRVDPVRATDTIVVTDPNGVVLIFTRPIYAPGEMDQAPEMVPSAAISLTWALAERVAAIINDKASTRNSAPMIPPPEAPKRTH